MQRTFVEQFVHTGGAQSNRDKKHMKVTRIVSRECSVSTCTASQCKDLGNKEGSVEVNSHASRQAFFTPCSRKQSCECLRAEHFTTLKEASHRGAGDERFSRFCANSAHFFSLSFCSPCFISWHFAILCLSDRRGTTISGSRVLARFNMSDPLHIAQRSGETSSALAEKKRKRTNLCA